MNYNKIKKNIKIFSKFFDILRNHLFLIFLLLLLLDSILIGYLFFKYSVQEDNISFQDFSVGLDQEILNNVLEVQKERQESFEVINFNEYLDLFRF